jgi:predicted N-formylglutamate amidohydrolase
MTDLLQGHPPVRCRGGFDGAPLLVLCDHASNVVPPPLHDLGLPGARLAEHIAWDIGAAHAAERILELAGGHGVFGNVSRLVIDCNRPLWNRGLVPAVSDGVAIPGNADVSQAELGRRIDQIWLPFHYAIVAALAQFSARGVRPFVLSVHSCTPVMNGRHRPWPVGIAHSSDERFSRPLLAALEAQGIRDVGDNQPYAVDDDDYSIVAHALRRDLPHAFVELRQDLVADADEARAWGERLHRALVAIGAL